MFAQCTFEDIVSAVLSSVSTVGVAQPEFHQSTGHKEVSQTSTRFFIDN